MRQITNRCSGSVQDKQHQQESFNPEQLNETNLQVASWVWDSWPQSSFSPLQHLAAIFYQAASVNYYREEKISTGMQKSLVHVGPIPKFVEVGKKQSFSLTLWSTVSWTAWPPRQRTTRASPTFAATNTCFSPDTNQGQDGGGAYPHNKATTTMTKQQYTNYLSQQLLHCTCLGDGEGYSSSCLQELHEHRQNMNIANLVGAREQL